MNDEVWLTGRATAPEIPRRLRAGELRLELDGPDIRRVAFRGIEVVNQVYFAFRDAPWNTLPGIISDYRIEEHADGGFEVGFQSNHRFPALDIDLSYVGSIIGTSDSALSYDIVVTANSFIEYNRIGLNLLHGTRTYAGRPFQSWLGGEARAGRLPEVIGAQPLIGERLAGLLAPFDTLELAPVDGVIVRFELEGDEFEMEDQRNFGDGTFKTYSTPLQRPSPFRLEPGKSLRQSVRISVRDERPGSSAPAASQMPLSLTIGASSGHTVPPYGLGQPDDGAALTDGERARVVSLRPDHIRVELALSAGLAACLERLAAAASEASALACALWLDISADTDDRDLLFAVVRAGCGVTPAPAFIHLATTRAEPPDAGTSGAMLAEIRALAATESPSSVVGVGSYMFYAELNRAPYDGSVVEALTFATCPTVHRSDDATVVENIDRLGDEVLAMRRYLGDRQLTVGPIMLAARHGPYPDGPREPGDLPARVDVRQVSLLAAALTMGHLAEFAAAGVEGLTFFETAGPMGVSERDAGSGLPANFRSMPGTIFPLWHVLADATELRGGQVLELRLAPDPVFTAPITALAVRNADGTHLLLASLQREAQSVVIEGLAGTAARVRTLDVTTVRVALEDPPAFRSSGRERSLEGGRLDLDLGPYAFIRVDAG